jgi:peptidoglycan/xylan/chitin deacetylase (PgdA/CDA1 family)
VTLGVVIPAHNAAETLAETLDSLLAQSRSDWQTIIVDDGSTDGTRQLAESYVARDKRFRLLSDGRPCEGVSAARNRGIAAAEARWLLFLDADDWIDPGYVKTMLGAVAADAATKVAFCNSCRVTPDGRHGTPWLSSEVARAPFEVFARQCVVAIHGFVLDRALVVELGGFDAGLRTCEDWDLWQRIARTGIPFKPVPGAFAFYRSRRRSLSSDVRAMLSDARTMIGRGFAPDARVPHPNPRYAAGADPGVGGTQEMAIALTSLWTASFEVGEGRDGSDLVLALPDRGGNVVENCRQHVLDGLMCGARTLLTGPFPADPGFLAAVRKLLQDVERAAAHPGLARLLEFSLEPEIFSPGRLSESLVAGRSMFVRVDVRRLEAIEAPPGVDTLNVEFRAGGQVLARTQVPLFGALSAGELCAIAIEAMSPTVFLRQSGLLHRPFFWPRLATSLVRLPATLRRAHPRRGPLSVFRPRLLARRVLVDAAVALVSRGAAPSNERALATLIAEGRAHAPPVLPIAAPSVAANGSFVDVSHSERTDRLPILMYHRIADDGPAALARYRTTPSAFAQQMAWLRQHGYHSVGAADVVQHLRDGRPFAGRPIMISFDDGYRDFHDAAWPILRAHDLAAEVFIVTDRVGKTAEWDAEHGTPAPLMDWAEIQALSAAGARFGSHMASHRHMTDLSSREMVREAASSRAMLEQALGRPCREIAAPFGETNDAFVHVAKACGYDASFTVDPGMAALTSDLLRLPRIEITGGWSLDAFAQALAPG